MPNSRRPEQNRLGGIFADFLISDCFVWAFFVIFFFCLHIFMGLCFFILLFLYLIFFLKRERKVWSWLGRKDLGGGGGMHDQNIWSKTVFKEILNSH